MTNFVQNPIAVNNLPWSYLTLYLYFSLSFLSLCIFRLQCCGSTPEKKSPDDTIWADSTQLFCSPSLQLGTLISIVYIFSISLHFPLAASVDCLVEVLCDSGGGTAASEHSCPDNWCVIKRWLPNAIQCHQPAIKNWCLDDKVHCH